MPKINPVELQKHLKGVDYPASKEDLIKNAEQQGADENALSLLRQLPDRQYEKPTEVNHEIGEMQ